MDSTCVKNMPTWKFFSDEPDRLKTNGAVFLLQREAFPWKVWSGSQLLSLFPVFSSHCFYSSGMKIPRWCIEYNFNKLFFAAKRVPNTYHFFKNRQSYSAGKFPRFSGELMFLIVLPCMSYHTREKQCLFYVMVKSNQRIQSHQIPLTLSEVDVWLIVTVFALHL